MLSSPHQILPITFLLTVQPCQKVGGFGGPYYSHMVHKRILTLSYREYLPIYRNFPLKGLTIPPCVWLLSLALSTHISPHAWISSIDKIQASSLGFPGPWAKQKLEWNVCGHAGVFSPERREDPQRMLWIFLPLHETFIRAQGGRNVPLKLHYFSLEGQMVSNSFSVSYNWMKQKTPVDHLPPVDTIKTSQNPNNKWAQKSR